MASYPQCTAPLGGLTPKRLGATQLPEYAAALPTTSGRLVSTSDHGLPRFRILIERGDELRLTNQKQRISALQQVPLLAGLSRAALGELAHRAEEIEVPAGAHLTRQSAVGAEVYVILAGSFAVRRGTDKVATLDQGGVFGEMSLLDGMPRSANVVAEKDSAVLVVHKCNFERLLETPRVAQRIMRTLAGRLREADAGILG